MTKLARRVQAKVKPVRLETSYQLIKKDILHCVLSPGSYISEPMLAERYGTGRSAVRAAMNRLVQEGLVLGANKKLGYQVTQFTLKDIQDLYTTRVLLESFTAGEAASKITRADLEPLKSLSKIKNEPDNTKSVETYLDANLEFHLTIARIAGNAYITQLLTRLMDRMGWIQHLIHTVGVKSYSPNDGLHPQLVKALGKGDKKQAVQLMTQHISGAKSMALEALSQSPTLQNTNIIGPGKKK